MTETALWGAIGAACGLAALGSLVYARLRSYRRGARAAAKLSMRSSPRTTGTETAFGRYQPMFRLLSGEDRDFVRKNHYCPKVADRWERSQRRVVRLYLKELAADFQILHRQARALAAQSPEQYHSLIPLLFKQQLVFWRALIWIDIRLTLGRGVSRINPETLVRAFEALQHEIARATTASQGQPA